MNKNRLITVGLAVLTVAAINRVPAARKTVMGN